MKRKLNSLHWPYIGAVALDHENRVVLLCECLCLEEDFDAYAFVVNSLEEMEPRRKKTSIRLIFADCFLTDEFLVMVGLERPNTTIAWDSFHLKSKVFPEHLGQHLFNELELDLGKMIYGETREEFEDAYKSIAVKLRNKPDKLQYIKKFYDHPERFAHYFVKTIPGNLRKSSSQPAESNHASIVARVSSASNQDIVQHIKALFDRQLELINLHEQEDAKYEKLSRHKAYETEDSSEAEAINTLSKWGYEEYWLDVAQEGTNYSHSVLPSGASRVHRKGTPDDSARIIDPGERCKCDRYLEFESMCEHEFAKHGCKFVRSLFSERLFQPGQMNEEEEENDDEEEEEEASDSIQADNSEASDSIQADNSAKFTQDFTQDDGDDDDDSSAADNITIAEMEKNLRKRSGAGNDTGGSSKKQKVVPVPHGRMAQACGTLTDFACSTKVKPEMSVAVFASILQLQDIARGKKAVDKVDKVVETAQQATQSRALLPRHGPEANK
jgi:hypothetical protein